LILIATMNQFTASKPCRLAVCLAMLLSCFAIRAQDSSARPQPPQPNRFLLIFETSPGMKKNLPFVRQMLGSLFASNIQGEMKSGDDLAVWTVDATLHTGTFPMESWSPDEAEDYAVRLHEFLEHQKYHRNASLAAVQPLLDHVVKTSDHLTVLIFCDSESRLIGTPYDSGANDIITNAAARLKGNEAAFIVVLRAYHGEYLGCSMNRSGLLNFPKFPAPPPPQPPAPVVVKQTTPPVPVPGPVVKPIPALVIVGTNAGTNVSALATLPPPSPVTTPASVSTTPAPAVIPQPAPVAPAPFTPQPIPAPAPPPTTTPAPTTTASASPPVSSPATENSSPASPATASSPATSGESTTSATVAAGTGTGPDTGVLVPLVIAGGAILAAIGIVVWLLLRNRRPEGSLISSSMQDDPRLPPRK
jgi:hypothetical protein